MILTNAIHKFIKQRGGSGRSSYIRIKIMTYQPRYIAYSSAHGNTPDEMLKADNNMMHEFIIWISQQWRKWETETGYDSAHKSEQAHTNFDNWLTMKETMIGNRKYRFKDTGNSHRGMSFNNWTYRGCKPTIRSCCSRGIGN